MVSYTEGKEKWKKRKQALSKVEKMVLTNKRLRLEASPSLSTAATPSPSSSSTPTAASSSAEHAPFCLPELRLPENEAIDDSSSASDCDSEFESASGTSSAESDFDAQGVFDDWVVSLRAYDRKILSVSLLETLRARQGLSVVDAAKESASFTGYNERTVRGYRKQFFEGKGKLEETRQGKYKRGCLLNDESLRLDAAMWARENAYKKGEPNMTAGKFCQYVNEELLPSHVLPANLPRTISLRTANRWLHHLGFNPSSHKKGSYVDGHEREDVVKSRKEFLKVLSDLKASHNPSPPCNDEMPPPPHPDTEFRKQVVLIYHDESIFNTNEGQTWMWAEPDTPVIQPKTQGSGIMVSNFVEQYGGYLHLNEEEFAVVKETNPDIIQTARVFLEYGAECKGYWTSEQFMENIKNAVKIAKFKYPSESYTVVWIFDQSSCHKAFAEDSLNARRMNVRPGGAQPKMRNTTWAGKEQKMVNDDGIAKGMRAVLEERGNKYN